MTKKPTPPKPDTVPMIRATRWLAEFGITNAGGRATKLYLDRTPGAKLDIENNVWMVPKGSPDPRRAPGRPKAAT